MRKSLVLFVICSLMLFGFVISYAQGSGGIGALGGGIDGWASYKMPGVSANVWTHIGPSDVQINDISIAPTDASTLIAAIDGDVHLAKTMDGGITWTSMEDSPTNLLAVKFDPQSASIIYAGNTIHTFRSGSGGEGWSDAQLKSGTDTSDFWIKSTDTQHLLVATTDHLARPYGIHLNTRSGWDRWWQTFGGKTLTLAGDPNNPSHVYAGTHEKGYVMRSTDSGYHWSLYSPGGSWVNSVRDIEVDLAANIFAATNDGLWRRNAEGWTKLSGLPTDDMIDLAIDRSVSLGIVYVGTDAHGVFVSGDGGGTWAAFNDGLGNLDITKLEISKSAPRMLYAGTESNGVWKIQLGEAPPTYKLFLPLILKPAAAPTATPTSTPTSSPSPTTAPGTPTHTPTWTPTPTPTPTGGPGRWIIENVDCDNYGYRMDDHSMRLDTAGRPHIAYGASHLFHAVRDNDIWQVEQVDGATQVGSYASLDLDAGGYAHISYRDNGESVLKYAYQDAGGWHLETVDNSADVGEYTSIGVDSDGYPHIIYQDATNATLKYAYKDAAGWHIETADTGVGYPGLHGSLALDTNNRPHISYRKSVEWSDGSSTESLIYAELNDEGWQRTILETSLAQYTSIALDSEGYPHISFYAWSESTLKYVYRDTEGWYTETVSDSYPDGLYNSIAVNGGAQLSFQGSLEYARRQVDGWANEVVEEGSSNGLYTSLALDTPGYPHISYFDSDASCVKYAYYTTSGTPSTPTPTATPTSTPTPTITPTLTRTPTVTPTTGAPGGIHGVVTYNNSPAADIELTLREYNGIESTVATTQTDSEGRYEFQGVPTLPGGHNYYVRFGPNGDDSRYVYLWYGPGMTGYTNGSTAHGGDFDIANVQLTSPSNNATTSLPADFTWDKRPVPTDTYRWVLFDLDTGDRWKTADLGYVGGITITGLPSEVLYDKAYGWYARPHKGDDSYGLPYYYRRVTFSSSAAKASDEVQIPMSTTDVTDRAALHPQFEQEPES